MEKVYHFPSWPQVCSFIVVDVLLMARFKILWLTLCQLHNEFVIEVSTTALFTRDDESTHTMPHGKIQCTLLFIRNTHVDVENVYFCISFIGSLQFLPIYTPSEEEKRNPALFAINVRRVMAK